MSDEKNIIMNKNQLIEWFYKGCKKLSDFKIGTEHEKFVYSNKHGNPVGYSGESGIKNILLNLKRFGWEEIKEKENIIALRKNDQNITLEPGGQLELSGAPLNNIHQTCSEVNSHLEQLRTIGTDLDVSFLGLGARIEGKLDSDLWMPKSRYDIMKKYMPSVGKQGLEMMSDTCTVQVNLDYSSEKDMIRKCRIAFKIQPIVTAMFANSPLVEMKKSEFISRRAAIWLDVDNDRCGIPSIVFDEGFGFEMWADFALQVPMYFIRRNNHYIDFSGSSFKNFISGNSQEFDGYEATLQDWEDHLSTIFTEVRVKKFIEMRGADAGPWENLCALPALWVGILYDSSALNEAENLSSEISLEALIKMYNDVPKYGLKTKINGRFINDYAKDLILISMNGLKARKKLDDSGNDERGYLKDLSLEIARGRNPAEKMLNLHTIDLNIYKDKIFKFFSY